MTNDRLQFSRLDIALARRRLRLATERLADLIGRVPAVSDAALVLELETTLSERTTSMRNSPQYHVKRFQDSNTAIDAFYGSVDDQIEQKRTWIDLAGGSNGGDSSFMQEGLISKENLQVLIEQESLETIVVIDATMKPLLILDVVKEDPELGDFIELEWWDSS